MKTQRIEHLVHKKSATKNKVPAATAITYGEIAVNYNAENPFLSIKDSNDNIIRIQDSSYVLCEGSLPASGRDKIYYVLKTTAAGTPIYELYIYNENTWEKISDLASDYSAGDNITIDNKVISSNQVENVTTAAYNLLVQGGNVNPAKLYNLTDQSPLNPEEYQKKLIIGDNLRLSPNNILDCTLDPNLYIIVASLPVMGIENKIYLLRVENEDHTVSFEQWGWINDEWVAYGKTKEIAPMQAGSGISINNDDQAISVSYASGLSFNASSALTTNIGAGLIYNSSQQIVPSYAAPIILNGSNQLTVSSSSTYTSTGTEMFTRAGAYNLYDTYLKPKALTLTPKTNVINSPDYWWTTAYQVGKLVIVNCSFGLKADASQDTVLFTGVPKPLGTDVSATIGDTLMNDYSPMVQVYNNSVRVRQGYALGNGHYFAGTFVYVAQ